MGQVVEKLARPGDFYGGEAMCLFHWHVGHLKRPYKRNLEPVLEIYNAQVDAGDFLHVAFSISSYVQYHLASGFDIARLDDNLRIFRHLYHDYKLQDEWQIQITSQVVANLRGESKEVGLLLGTTIEHQTSQVRAMTDGGMDRAVDYFYFMRAYIGFFYREYDIMKECLGSLSAPAEGPWKLWMIFFECIVAIHTSPTKKKDLMKYIAERQDLLDQSGPNAGAMTSILEAEVLIREKEGISALRVQDLYGEAIEAASRNGATHLTAFALESLALHFLSTKNHKCAEHVKKAHDAYNECSFFAKAIDIETNFANYLEESEADKRVAANFIDYNQSMVRRRQIGGVRPEPTMFDLNDAKNTYKKAKKFGMKFAKHARGTLSRPG